MAFVKPLTPTGVYTSAAMLCNPALKGKCCISDTRLQGFSWPQK